MPPRLGSRIKNFLSYTGGNTPDGGSHVDVREEYANAFRTESYNEFWTRVTALSHRDSATCLPRDSTTSARLSSYRIFTENLLDPDQPTVNRILALAQTGAKAHSLLSDYFSETANASLLCSFLLEDIDHIRSRYKSFQGLVKSAEPVEWRTEINFSVFANRLIEFSRLVNPLVLAAPSPTRVRVLQAECSGLLKRLESGREKARAKLRFIRRLKQSSGVLLVALTVSLTAIVASHAFALAVAPPSLAVASIELASTKKLLRVSAQLDAAAKGTYTLSRDLDTTSRLVARLNDELEHVQAVIGFWVGRGEDTARAGCEVARQLKMSDDGFSQQLDELEEHIFLCFMTINRARNLVVKEILDSDEHACPIGPKSKS